MEAFLARAARGRPAALAWETNLVGGDDSAWFKQEHWLMGRPKKAARLTEKKRWNLYTKLPLALMGLELD